jgi:hypothetical protein
MTTPALRRRLWLAPELSPACIPSVEGRDAVEHVNEASMPMPRGSKAKREKFLAICDSGLVIWKDWGNCDKVQVSNESRREFNERGGFGLNKHSVPFVRHSVRWVCSGYGQFSPLAQTGIFSDAIFETYENRCLILIIYIGRCETKPPIWRVARWH